MYVCMFINNFLRKKTNRCIFYEMCFVAQGEHLANYILVAS